MGFRALRVINEDRIAPGEGFGTHPHRDMEIITYVLEGELEHKDSMGNGSVIRPGEVQRMSAGSGVTHSEHNPSPTTATHLLQIWIRPAVLGIAPSYEQRSFLLDHGPPKLRVIVSGDGRDQSLLIHQNVRLYAARLTLGTAVAHRFANGRYGWLQVARGTVDANGHTLAAGDGAALSDERRLTVTARDAAEVLLFDLA
jgi:redox-sensitive bicupin YhaK (pirin superfamily)